MARRLLLGCALACGATLIATPAYACGGLIGPNGAVNLARTTTLAAYHNGIEHYVTAFTFTGATKGTFGSIVPLPGIPTKVERGGDWTLQRLEREVAPPVPKGLFLDHTGVAFAAAPEIILQTKIDALDITILRGGGNAVGKWALDHGFLLTPDAPQVLRPDQLAGRAAAALGQLLLSQAEPFAQALDAQGDVAHLPGKHFNQTRRGPHPGSTGSCPDDSSL